MSKIHIRPGITPEGIRTAVRDYREETAIEELAANSYDADATTVLILLHGDSGACDDFMAKVSRMGWNEEMRRSGEMMHFHLRGDGYFPADAVFPRLADDFVPPSDVVSVKYTVDLADVPSLDLVEAQQKVKAGFHA